MFFANIIRFAVFYFFDNFNNVRSHARIFSSINEKKGDKDYLQRYVNRSKILTFSKRRRRPQEKDGLDTTTTTTTRATTSDYFYFPYDHCIDFVKLPTTTSVTDQPTTMLIHGGDIWDKGGYDLYVIRQLLDLKRRYPDRVHFIMGNRDVNKLRILQELGLPHPASQPSSTATEHSQVQHQQEERTSDSTTSTNASGNVPFHTGLWWLQGTGIVGDPECIRNSMVDDTSTTSSSSCAVPSTTPADRLQWLLSRTMGSPNAFEYRKEELVWEKQQLKQQEQQQERYNNSNDEVYDDDVVQSYRTSCHPNGEMGQFLSQSQLALRIGQVLFVHGAIPLTKQVVKSYLLERKTTTSKDPKIGRRQKKNFWDDMAWAMPWIDEVNDLDRTRVTYNENVIEKSNEVPTINHWIESLNTFAKRCLKQWKKEITKSELRRSTDKRTNKGTADEEIIWATKGGYGNGQNYTALIQYGMARLPDFRQNPTVVYNSWFTDGMPNRFNYHKEGIAMMSHGVNDKDCYPCPYMQLTKEFFEAGQFRLVVSGHQPQGDLPNTIRVDSIKLKDAVSAGRGTSRKSDADTRDDHDAESADFSKDRGTTGYILCCDTSYSGSTQWFLPRSTSSTMKDETSRRHNVGRGDAKSFRSTVAVSEVLIELDHDTRDLLDVRYHGVLSDGTEYEVDNLLEELPNTNSAAEHDTNEYPVVGEVTPNMLAPPIDESPHQGQWWTKAIFKDGSHLLYAAKGFDTWNYLVPPPVISSEEQPPADAVAKS